MIAQCASPCTAALAQWLDLYRVYDVCRAAWSGARRVWGHTPRPTSHRRQNPQRPNQQRSRSVQLVGDNQWEQPRQVGSLARGLNPARFHRIHPRQLPHAERDPGVRIRLDHGGWGPSSMRRACDALHRTKWRHAHLDAATRRTLSEFLEQESHRRCRDRELRANGPLRPLGRVRARSVGEGLHRWAQCGDRLMHGVAANGGDDASLGHTSKCAAATHASRSDGRRFAQTTRLREASRQRRVPCVP